MEVPLEPPGSAWSEQGAWARALSGARAPFDGLAFLAGRAALWPWLAAPVALMAGAVGVAGWWVVTWTPAAVARVARPPQGLFGDLWWGLVVVLMVVLFAALATVAWAVSTVVATPFYDTVSARVDAEIRGVAHVPVAPLEALIDAAWSVAHTGLALAMLAAVQVVLAGVAFVPVLDVVVPFAELAFGFLWVARELLDFPLARRRLGFGAKLDVLRGDLVAFGALGAVSTALLCVPVLNLVSMPAAVVGCTLLLARIEGKSRAG